jgi:hypothetical protein
MWIVRLGLLVFRRANSVVLGHVTFLVPRLLRVRLRLAHLDLLSVTSARVLLAPAQSHESSVTSRILPEKLNRALSRLCRSNRIGAG